jgi:hypothetical protein
LAYSLLGCERVSVFCNGKDKVSPFSVVVGCKIGYWLHRLMGRQETWLRWSSTFWRLDASIRGMFRGPIAFIFHGGNFRHDSGFASFCTRCDFGEGVAFYAAAAHQTVHFCAFYSTHPGTASLLSIHFLHQIKNLDRANLVKVRLVLAGR